MPELSKLYQKPAGVAVKPKLMPAAERYVGIIKGHEILAAPSDRQVNYEESIRFQIGTLEWPESVEPEDRQEVLQEGGKPTPINLSTKNFTANFYDNRLDILDDFIRSLGVEPKGRGYAQVLADCTGSRVLFDVKWRPDMRSPGEFVAFADNVRGEDEG